MLPGNGLRHLVIAVHCVTPRLLVNELRHMGKWRLNAGRSPHVEKKTLGKMTAILLKWDTTQALPAAWTRTHTHTHTVDCQAKIEDNTTHRWCLR